MTFDYIAIAVAAGAVLLVLLGVLLVGSRRRAGRLPDAEGAEPAAGTRRA